jgi:hypothetical protein
MGIGDFGQSKVHVMKDQLLNTMRENAGKHRAAFLEAQEGYREEVIKELDRMLKDAREGRTLRYIVALEAPEDHSADYERVISMLEWSTADEIEITETQFSNFVLDKWNWTERFVGTNAKYSKK